MTTTFRISVAALLLAPLLAIAAPSKDMATTKSAEVSATTHASNCSCHEKKLAEPKAQPEVADWIRAIWTSP